MSERNSVSAASTLGRLTATVQGITFRAVDPLALPAYKGSTFRGALGHAFKQVACALRTQVCDACLLRHRCAYSVCFETPVPEGADIMRKYPKAPHPFVLEPPSEERLAYEPGEELRLRLWLVGRASEYLPHFIYAFEEMGERGLGRGRGKAELVTFSTETDGGETVLYHHHDKTLRGMPAVIEHGAVLARVETLRGKPLRVHFETPTRVMRDGELTQKCDFSELFPALMRRLHTLSYFFCGGEFPGDVRALLDAAGGVHTRHADIRWMDWVRYSARQDRKMELGGFTGIAEYEAPPEELLPYLCWGELLHVGKASAFGLGKYRLEMAQ